MNIASQALFINLARMLWAVNVEALPSDSPNMHNHQDEENTALV